MLSCSSITHSNIELCRAGLRRGMMGRLGEVGRCAVMWVGLSGHVMAVELGWSDMGCDGMTGVWYGIKCGRRGGVGRCDVGH